MTQRRVQRLVSPGTSCLSLPLHVLGIASFAYNFHFLTLWDTPFQTAYGGHYQFLTIIGLAASLAAFVFAALADVTQSVALFQIKNAIAVIATPLEVVITILYWSLKAIDPQLLMPDESFALPRLADLGFHLAPAALLTLDLVLFSPPWTIPAYAIMALSTTFAFAYWYWVELCFSKNGWYPYPMFGLLSTSQRVLLFAFSALLVTLTSGGLKWLYARINGFEEARKEPHKPLKKL
ncbi:hypothetical protein CDD81_2128 [Ophiocordyceps australis]|uniref:FAR-17a/AIG1-like protein n=1 Tax=Ophiocordyceps australis TaxID=1399860 RepID=A0A2C5XZE3_9HYPO|nr:hypothetical protein CDD81_2128 [Ophiocordyceps australis]